MSLSRNDRSTCAIITLCVINVKRYAWRATKLGLVGSRQANERARDRGALVLIVGAKAHQVPLTPSSQVITTDDGPKGQALQGSLETGPHSVDHYALRRQGPAHGTAGNSRRDGHRGAGGPPANGEGHAGAAQGGNWVGPSSLLEEERGTGPGPGHPRGKLSREVRLSWSRTSESESDWLAGALTWRQPVRIFGRAETKGPWEPPTGTSILMMISPTIGPDGTHPDFERYNAAVQCTQLMDRVWSRRARSAWGRPWAEWFTRGSSATAAVSTGTGATLIAHLSGSTATVIGYFAIALGLSGVGIVAMRPSQTYMVDLNKTARFEKLWWDMYNYTAIVLPTASITDIKDAIDGFTEEEYEISQISGGGLGAGT